MKEWCTKHTNFYIYKYNQCQLTNTTTHAHRRINFSIGGNDVIQSVHLSDYEMHFAEDCEFCFMVLTAHSLLDLAKIQRVENKPILFGFLFHLKVIGRIIIWLQYNMIQPMFYSMRYLMAQHYFLIKLLYIFQRCI